MCHTSSHALRTLVPNVLLTPRALVPCASRTLWVLMPYVLPVPRISCLACSCASRASCYACFRTPHATYHTCSCASRALCVMCLEYKGFVSPFFLRTPSAMLYELIAPFVFLSFHASHFYFSVHFLLVIFSYYDYH